MTAPQITVHGSLDSPLVVMGGPASGRVFVRVGAAAAAVMTGGFTSSDMVTDLRRLADSLAAAQAGTWQPTPALPTGGAP